MILPADSWEERTRRSFATQRRFREFVLSVLFFVAALAISGCCKDNVCRATVAANELHDLADAGHVLVDECTARFKAATNVDELHVIEDQCNPIGAAYAGVRHSWAEMVLVLQALKAGRVVADLPDLLKAAAMNVEQFMTEIEGAKEMSK